MEIFYLLISLIASTAGAICGVGGGVIIKPALDLFRLGSIASISFLSGCTVLAMSLYSVSRSVLSRRSLADYRACTPLAIGAAVGGVVGKALFSALIRLAADPAAVGRIQSICLLLMTGATFIYTLCKHRIRTHHLTGPAIGALIGFALGVLSSFLGIGGGPINLVVLFFFFSMDAKMAAQSSLYVILVSQATSLLTTLLTGSVPRFGAVSLALMIAGGLLGGAIGRVLYGKMTPKAIERVFLGMMAVIMAVSLSNALR